MVRGVFSSRLKVLWWARPDPFHSAVKKVFSVGPTEHQANLGGKSDGFSFSYASIASWRPPAGVLIHTSLP